MSLRHDGKGVRVLPPVPCPSMQKYTEKTLVKRFLGSLSILSMLFWIVQIYFIDNQRYGFRMDKILSL